MSEVINLRMARKAKARAEAEKQSAGNRAKFGQTRAEREVRRIDEERAAKKLDQAKREGDSGTDKEA